MDLDAPLRALAAFARRRSFSAAAVELHISQPAVFRHIADLEREAGVKLVVCRSRGGVLTPAGEFLSNHILRAQALLAQAARGIGEFRQPTSGSLSIVASGVPGTYLLPEVMARFQHARPSVRVSIELAPVRRRSEACFLSPAPGPAGPVSAQWPHRVTMAGV
jgi:DNA-binding transcriptional LysR family regulator